MKTRYKRPDKKNALSLTEAAKRDMEFTLAMKVTESSGPTIVRNIYECFRMLGDALLVSKGIESEDHSAPIKELTELSVNTQKPISLLWNLKRLRHNINYYGYRPNTADIEDIISIAKAIFRPLYEAVKEKVTKDDGSAAKLS
ncbi:MAG: hypothetical protein NTY20_05230 [Candidatus Aenigmarchaeota archaeon]|nr:hypothetical protein [Candidatus Aenigmarchaeota archaeon]